MKSATGFHARACASDQMPASHGVMRPSGVTPAASTQTRPAPPTARLPRCTRCQSFGMPSSEEYWHIGDTRTRLGRVTERSARGEKSCDMAARWLWTWHITEVQPPLTIRAGPRALEKIRAHGLDPAMVEIVPGAAGGPKGLGISGLDRAIFGEWLPSAPRMRHLIGASIGAWRFAAASTTDPVKSLGEFARLYTEQSYPRSASRKFVSDAARTMLGALFKGREAEIL